MLKSKQANIKNLIFISARMKMVYCTVVGDYINITKTTCDFNFDF